MIGFGIGFVVGGLFGFCMFALLSAGKYKDDE